MSDKKDKKGETAVDLSGIEFDLFTEKDIEAWRKGNSGVGVIAVPVTEEEWRKSVFDYLCANLLYMTLMKRSLEAIFGKISTDNGWMGSIYDLVDKMTDAANKSISNSFGQSEEEVQKWLKAKVEEIDAEANGTN